MELNAYQKNALERFGRWIEALDAERARSDKTVSVLGDVGNPTLMRDAANYPRNAWMTMVDNDDAASGTYADRRDGADRPIPHACFKIPTGGGKTLVAAAALERLGIKTGLVLWVVHSKKIHEQSRDAIRRRDSPIRQRLDRGSGGRVKCMDKDDPFTKYDAEQSLCVMPLTLGSVNRNGKSKDFLLMNRDSGTYQSFFPDSDDAAGNAALLKKHPELDTHMDGCIIHSLANVFRMLRPTVILDEAHRAYAKRGREYAGMISSLSPRMVVEMSATPNETISNLLVNVSGSDLREEEMIKMPVNIHIQTDPDWKGLLGAAKARLKRLENDAESLDAAAERYIRPIALVRVERTGKDMRDGRLVHSEDVREYLTDKLGVPPDQIAVQTSDRKEIDGIMLMSETIPIRWIITKSALMEGWDCSFAYVLVMLDNLKADMAVTQLIGRVLRQPQARLTGTASLDECYVYCHSHDTGAAVDSVKRGLENVGMADMKRMVAFDTASEVVKIRKRPNIHSETFLPLVLHKDGDSWAELDYGRHVLSEVDFAAVGAPDPSNFSPDTQGWHEISVMADGSKSSGARFEAHTDRATDVADFALPLSDMVPNVWQAARIAQEFVGKLLKAGKTRGDIYNGLPYLLKVLRDHVGQAVDRQAEAIFRKKLGRGDIRFDLEIEDRNYRIRTYEVVKGNLLQRSDGRKVQKTLFEPVFEEEFVNSLETGFAVYLDTKEAVTWWHRVAARGSNAYVLRGWRDVRVYPDFIVMANGSSDRLRLGIYDTKGEHLLGNPDTIYKKDLLNVLEESFNYGTVKVSGSRMSGEFRLVRENTFEEILAD